VSTPSSVIPSDEALVRAIGAGEREALHVLGREEQPDGIRPVSVAEVGRALELSGDRGICARLVVWLGRFVRGLGRERDSWEGEPLGPEFATGRL